MPRIFFQKTNIYRYNLTADSDRFMPGVAEVIARYWNGFPVVLVRPTRIIPANSTHAYFSYSYTTNNIRKLVAVKMTYEWIHESRSWTTVESDKMDVGNSGTILWASKRSMYKNYHQQGHFFAARWAVRFTRFHIHAGGKNYRGAGGKLYNID